LLKKNDGIPNVYFDEKLQPETEKGFEKTIKKPHELTDVS
jgi:hypothetical protein